jgi:hypothetical protein
VTFFRRPGAYLGHCRLRHAIGAGPSSAGGHLSVGRGSGAGGALHTDPANRGAGNLLALDALIHRPDWGTWTRQTRPWLSRNCCGGRKSRRGSGSLGRCAARAAHVPLIGRRGRCGKTQAGRGAIRRRPMRRRWPTSLRRSAAFSSDMGRLARPRQQMALQAVLASHRSFGYVAQRCSRFFGLGFCSTPHHRSTARGMGLAPLRKPASRRSSFSHRLAAALPTKAYNPLSSKRISARSRNRCASQPAKAMGRRRLHRQEGICEAGASCP